VRFPVRELVRYINDYDGGHSGVSGQGL
jgi:hypothetical protein